MTSIRNAGVLLSLLILGACASTGGDTMPPIIGTAMRCMTSEPVPVFHRIGKRPAVMATTVIIFGRTRSTAPSMMAP